MRREGGVCGGAPPARRGPPLPPALELGHHLVHPFRLLRGREPGRNRDPRRTVFPERRHGAGTARGTTHHHRRTVFSGQGRNSCRRSSVQPGGTGHHRDVLSVSTRRTSSPYFSSFEGPTPASPASSS